jgi:hypothetical protein
MRPADRPYAACSTATSARPSSFGAQVLCVVLWLAGDAPVRPLTSTALTNALCFVRKWRSLGYHTFYVRCNHALAALKEQIDGC